MYFVNVCKNCKIIHKDEIELAYKNSIVFGSRLKTKSFLNSLNTKKTYKIL